jgi:hypothetical protein
MLAITYSLKKEIKVAKWGTPKKYFKKKFKKIRKQHYKKPISKFNED